jgi:hypothetical protein
MAMLLMDAIATIAMMSFDFDMCCPTIVQLRIALSVNWSLAAMTAAQRTILPYSDCWSRS